MLDSKKQYKLRKFISELKQYRGRHTELVSVYIPSGYDIIKIIQHLAQEQGTASNIKDKTNRLNVQNALERMIRHLRLYKKTPDNGLAAFSGNIASQEGKQDIKVWSIEPPVPVNIRLYRCDHVFVLNPLEEMMQINEIYGLIVMDNREATIGFLKGKSIQVIRDFTSSVPGKVKVGGWCLNPETLVLMSDNKVKKILDLKVGDKVESYDLKNNKSLTGTVTNTWTRKLTRTLNINFKALDTRFEIKKHAVKSPFNIVTSYDHLFFVFSKDVIKEIPAGNLFNFSSKKSDYFLVGEGLRRFSISEVFIEKNITSFIDIETTTGNFFANGILVHNSQQRYSRLREEAANEFYKRIAEVVNVEFAAEAKNLKGIIIGGPGPTKETFANGSHLHTDLKKKVIAVKDITYTDEHGLHELVEKAQDVIAESEIAKEKQIVNELFTLLATNSEKVVYGEKDVAKALDYGAVDKLLLSESFEKIDEFEEKANSTGTNVFIVSVETKEGAQLRDLGGVAAILRYAMEF